MLWIPSRESHEGGLQGGRLLIWGVGVGSVWQRQAAGPRRQAERQPAAGAATAPQSLPAMPVAPPSPKRGPAPCPTPPSKCGLLRSPAVSLGTKRACLHLGGRVDNVAGAIGGLLVGHAVQDHHLAVKLHSRGQWWGAMEIREHALLERTTVGQKDCRQA